jgi:hypothetical protein
MVNKATGNSEMSSIGFASNALKQYVAPPGSGVNVSDRIRRASRKLGWSYTRTRDVWYGDPRVSVSVDEMRAIEEKTGVTYGRAEVRSIEQLIAQADALLEGPNEDFYRPAVIAFRAFIGALAGTRTEK